MLISSVLTSCSDLDLQSFFRECRASDSTCKFELFLLRESDIRDIRDISGRGSATKTVAGILSERRNVNQIVEWVAEQLSAAGITDAEPIAAIATYFPGISSLSCDRETGRPNKRRRIAISALANAVRIGIALKRLGKMRRVVVEAVCGTVLDACGCASCVAHEQRIKKRFGRDIDVIVEFERELKYRVLLDSLKHVVDDVAKDGSGEVDWAIALELEPGPTYVLNDGAAMGDVFRLLGSAAASTNMNGRVGFNIDIGHLKIAGVDSAVLRSMASAILHAHTSDNPGMHTRDQAVGEWHAAESRESPDYEYLRVLNDMSDEECHPLFTRSVSLELEGCSRFRWIYTSLAAMEYQLRLLNSSTPLTTSIAAHHFGQSGGSESIAFERRE